MGIPPDIDPDEPVRLADIVKIAFPSGDMTVAGLRRERDRDRLVTEMIAGKEYTTLNHIKRMRELCRVPAKVHDFGSGLPAEKETGSSRKPSGSSKTAGNISPQDALRAKLKRNHPPQQSRP